MANSFEYEAKIVLPDCKLLDEIRKYMENELGLSLERIAVEEDIYFQHPCRNFMETDEALRIRKYSDGIIELTYKGPRSGKTGIKSREEISIVVASSKIMEILEKLGFRKAIIVRKKRRYYRIGAITVSLDEVDGLGCFIEVEYKGIDPSQATKEIENTIKLLRLSNYPKTTLSYLELLVSATRQKD